MNGRPVDVQNDARPSAAAHESSPVIRTKRKTSLGNRGLFCVLKVVNMFSVGAAKDTSGLWDLRSDSLADSRENFLGDNVGFRFFFVCHFLPP